MNEIYSLVIGSMLQEQCVIDYDNRVDWAIGDGGEMSQEGKPPLSTLALFNQAYGSK